MNLYIKEEIKQLLTINISNLIDKNLTPLFDSFFAGYNYQKINNYCLKIFRNASYDFEISYKENKNDPDESFGIVSIGKNFENLICLLDDFYEKIDEKEEGQE